MKVFLLKIVSLALFFSVFFSCQQEQKKVIEGITISADSLAPYIKAQFNTQTILVCEDELPHMDTLSKFYAHRDYMPLWWDALTKDSSAWANLKANFKHSNLHGMDYRYYYIPLIEYYKSKVAELSTADSMYRYLAELEVIISNGYIKMYSDIANGRTKPKDVYGYTYMLPRNNLKDEDYIGFLESSNKITRIEALHAQDTTYQELLKVMKYYLNKKKEARQNAIDFSAYPKLEVGDSAQIVLQVIQRLKARNLPDSSIHSLKDTMVFTRELREQIKKLQEKYSLTPDGIMGYKTYKLINATPTDKIDQVRANLERQRWFTKPTSKPFVYVNLPEYIAELHWQDSIKSMKVCIGKNLPDNYDEMVLRYTDSGWLHKLPRNMETPQIASKITYMVINPTWTVPYSIIRREMWWKLVRNPKYLSENHYIVFRGKEQVDGDTIQWSKVNKNKIPYTVVETPGPHNSLGTVKYMFNNPFSIYLHDTPHKKAFKRTQRAVSHGCVRLEQPLLFGEFLMQNSKKYNADDFRILMGYPPLDEERLEEYDPTDTTASLQKLTETTRVFLQKPMPLYMDYRTVYYDNEWKLHFCYDIYDQNKLILREMDRM